MQQQQALCVLQRLAWHTAPWPLVGRRPSPNSPSTGSGAPFCWPPFAGWLKSPCQLHLALHPQTAESKLRMITSVWNVCDLLSFAPPLLETVLRATGTSIRCVHCSSPPARGGAAEGLASAGPKRGS